MERITNNIEENKFVPEELLRKFEAARIEPETGFKDVYSDYQKDQGRVASLQEKFQGREQEKSEESLGPVGEALVYDRIKSGIFGAGISARPASLYDDYFHGADLLVEAAHFQEPVVSTVDVTLNQEDIKGVLRRPHFSAEENPRPIGLNGKLGRIKKHIDYVANINPGTARSLGAWLQGGGLHERQTDANREYFKMAERGMLVKYYVSPESADENRINCATSLVAHRSSYRLMLRLSTM